MVDDRGTGFDSGQEAEIFLGSTASRPALELGKPPTQWMSGAGGGYFSGGR
jgi:hypothetical protein